MLNILIILSTILMPLEFRPEFDTYQELYSKTTAYLIEQKRPLYDGTVQQELCQALSDELDTTYQMIIDHLSKAPEGIKKELEAFDLTDHQISEILAFRYRELERLKKEQQAWGHWKTKEKAFGYQQYAGGSFRLVYPWVVYNGMTYSRVQMLRNQYQGIFAPLLLEKHICGKWESDNDTILFERRGDNRYYAKKGSGTYSLDQGFLSLKIDESKLPIQQGINILSKDESLILEYSDFAVFLPNAPFCQMIEEFLVQKLENAYQNALAEIDGFIQGLSEEEAKDIENLKLEKEDLIESQKAWETWSKVSFIDRMQLLLSGKTFSYAHSLEHNQALLERVKHLSFVTDLHWGPPPDYENTLILGKFNCEEMNELWEFKKEGDNFAYSVSKEGICIEKGTYFFDEGMLQLCPTQNSRKTPSSIALSEKETILYRKYLLGTLATKDRYKKMTAIDY